MAALLLLNRVSRSTSSISLHRVAGTLGFNSFNAQIHGDRISGTLFRVRSLATLAEGASHFNEMVSVNQRKYYLLGGKGGVGKTSCAASLAVKFASHGHPTIVVSTDPAHSLSDSFSQDLSGGVLKPVQGVDSPLLALEITPEIMKDEIKRQTGDKSVKNMMDSMGLGMFAGELGDLNLEDMLNAASPGIDEIAAISKALIPLRIPLKSENYSC
ncbi:putative arsenite-transporting ATPase [Arabidopsis thaliana]